jgi:hypothetical protein
VGRDGSSSSLVRSIPVRIVSIAENNASMSTPSALSRPTSVV